MKRVYVAGAYSADNVITVFDNMRKGIRASTEVMLNGMAPFCPWIDHHFALSLRMGEKITLEMYYAYSLAWLSVSQAVLVLPGYENSKGTLREIETAKDMHIPVFYNLEELIKWNKLFGEVLYYGNVQADSGV